MDFTANGTAIAAATRTPNVIKWDSPNWGGFTLTAAYSTGISAQEADLTGTETGMAYNVKAVYTAANWGVGGSIWNSTSDGATSATQVEQDSQAFWGWIRFGGFKVGAGVNMAEVTTGSTSNNDRMSYTIPLSFNTGPHTFYAHYTVADDDDATTATDGAEMIAFAYVYDLSKRTSVGITFATIDNDTGAAYNFFTNTGGLGSASSAMTAGEDGQLVAFTVRHAF
jgi:predicted porin